MPFGLFGKLPQKRDFVSVNLPHAVLNPFETWLQQAVAASRNDMGRTWENYYMVAPIWHFWLGPEIFGTTVAGALMPSVDQVGRYFPLSILYVADQGERLPPPLLAPMDDWYAQIDQRLLSVLGDHPVDVGGLLAGLVPPSASTTLGIAIAGAEPTPPMVAPSVPAPVEPPKAASPSPPASAAKPAAKQAEPAPIEDWAAVPMAPAAKEPTQAAVESKPAASPPAAIAATAPAASVWDVPETDSLHEDVAAIAAPEAAEETAPTGGSLWDELPSLNATDFAAPKAAASDVPLAPPVATEAEAPAAKPFEFAPLPDEPVSDNELVNASLADPEPPVSAEPEIVLPSPPPMPRHAAPPKLAASEFKGGVVMAIEPGRSMSEALAGLIELDYRKAAEGRGYWWCAASSTGTATLFSRQGMPDPYFFSRMLMWTGR